jgi:hypothetical protein
MTRRRSVSLFFFRIDVIIFWVLYHSYGEFVAFLKKKETHLKGGAGLENWVPVYQTVGFQRKPSLFLPWKQVNEGFLFTAE